MLSVEQLGTYYGFEQGIWADLQSDLNGAYLAAEEEGQQEPPVLTPIVDPQGLALVRAKLPATDGLSKPELMQKMNKSSFVEHAFEAYPPKHPGIYAVAKDVSIIFVRPNEDPRFAEQIVLIGPGILRELVPPSV